MTKQLLLIALTLILTSCGTSSSIIKCRGEAECLTLTEPLIEQFEQSAIHYFGDDRGFKHINHYSISPNTEDLEMYCGADRTCYTGESIVVADIATEYELCIGIMTEYGQAYAYEDNGQGGFENYDQNHNQFLQYYNDYVPTYCESFYSE